MEEKQLNFDVPLLSLRRYIPVPMLERTEEKVTKVVATRPFPPPYKSEIKTGPVGKAGSVPFVWEKSPGKPRDGVEFLTQNSKLAHEIPNLPPGWKFETKKQQQHLHSTDSAGRKDNQCPTNNTDLRNLVNVEYLQSDDDECPEYSDARDTFSRTESSYVNCSPSGLSNSDNSQLKPTMNLSMEAEIRDFVIGRFLPAAKALASEATPFNSKKPTQTCQTTRNLSMATTKSTPVVYPKSPLIVQQQVVPIESDESEEGEDYDKSDYISTKACGLLPRFCLRSSFCLLNPVPMVKASGLPPHMQNTLGNFKNDTTTRGSVRVFDDEQLASRRDSQAFDSHQLNCDYSPHRQNVDQQSPFHSESHPSNLSDQSLKILSDEGRKCRSSLRELLKSDSGSDRGSRSSSPVIEKTLFVDSVQELDKPMSNISLRELMSPKFSEKDIPFEAGIFKWNTNIKPQMSNKEENDIYQCPETKAILDLQSPKKLSLSRTSENLDEKASSSYGDMITRPSADKGKKVRFEDLSGYDILNVHSSECIQVVNNCIRLAELLKPEDDMSMQSVLPPPLPNSPSESWLCRTLPASSSRIQSSSPRRNIQFRQRKHIPKAPAMEPMLPYSVRTSNARFRS